MRVEDGYVYLTNVLGREVRIFVPRPSNDAQNYDLNSKDETKDCSACRCNIPRNEALQLIDLGITTARGKWTPPERDAVKGACVWGVSPKVLVERPKGSKHCGLLKKSE